MNIKYFAVLFALPLVTACVSIDLPGVVSESAKVVKDTYRAVSTKNEEPQAVASTADSAEGVSNTYIGLETQTAAEVKNLCVSEASTKLFKATGKEVPYTVTQNTISTVNNAIAATCRVKANKVVTAQLPEKK